MRSRLHFLNASAPESGISTIEKRKKCQLELAFWSNEKSKMLNRFTFCSSYQKSRPTVTAGQPELDIILSW